jgi:DNA-binding transcriptional LysR family regulator
MIDRYLIRYFLAVIDQGSFSRAAQQCGVSQPTLSIGIAKLEALLDKKLFDRSNRRVAQTEAGSRFAEHARRIEFEFVEAERISRAVPPRDPVRLGVLATVPVAMLQAGLRGIAGEAALEVVEGRGRELDAMLDRGRLDAVLTVLTRVGLPTRELFSEGYGMALPLTHRHAGETEIAVEALAGETMLVRRHCEALPQISRFFTDRGVRPVMAARTLSDAHALAYVEAGLGITMVPSSFARPGLALARVAGFDLRRTIALQTRPQDGWRLDDGNLLDRFARRLLAA